MALLAQSFTTCHNPLRYNISPSLGCAANAPKHAIFIQSYGRKPRVNGAFDPVRYGHRPNMPAVDCAPAQADAIPGEFDNG
jgi:hypothetical protein